MNIKGFHASTSGGKKVVAVSLILALVLASISVIAAFAAPTKSKSAFGSQLRELDFDRAWFNSARLNAANFVNTSDPGRAQQYLSQYAFALNQADAIVAGRGANTTNNNNNGNNSSSSNSSNTNNTNFGSAQGDLAQWLHMMRGLQGKLASIGFTASVSNSNVAGSGVPVTGGTSSSSSSSGASAATATPGADSSTTPTATPTTSSSSSSSSATTPTATPATGSSSASTPTATPTTGSSSSSSSSSTSSAGIPNTGSSANLNRSDLAKIWGPQFSQLEAARAWLTNFKSNPANLVNSSDPAKTQQWISQYEFALRQADAIVMGRGTNVASNNNNGNNSSSSSTSGSSVNSNSNNTQFGSAHGDLAQWLHLMRDLQVKLTSGVNGTSSSTMP